MITLYPLYKDVFTDGTSQEPLHTRALLDGQVIYVHQSGYGHIPENQVIIKEQS